MKQVHFITPTLLSYIDLFSMGGSEKADDDTRLGTFCSGFKYSMALAKRHNVELSINVFDSEFSEGHDRKRRTQYYIDTYIESCEQTGKEKELIKIIKEVSAENFHSGNTTDYGGGDYPQEELLTGYSVKMGIDWKPYMLLREIYSNMLDEGGFYTEDIEGTLQTYGTRVTLEFEEGSEFDEIWQNRHLYINEKEPLFKVSDTLDILENEEGYLRIYKQNILVYEDKNKPSRFAFNIKFGAIDERRILSNLYSVEGDIIDQIRWSKNEDFLRQIITKDFKCKDNEFLSDRGVYSTASDLLQDIAFEVYEEFGEVSSYNWLMDSIKERKDCRISGKKIKSIGDSLWSYTNTVTVETSPETFSTPEVIETEEEIFEDNFAVEIRKHYNFTLDAEVKKAKLKGSKAIADKYNNCLIVDNDFDILADFPEFLIQYIDLTRKGNVVSELGKYICELLKK